MTAHRIALATLVMTFALLVVGGTVNPTGSSLACPDWPLCFGKVFPEMKNGVEFEHTHRIVASIVGVMTLLLGILLWRQKPADRGLRWLGAVVVSVVTVQAVLGGLTVIYRLPPAISTGHLGLSMLFFVLLIFAVLRTREPIEARQPQSDHRGYRWAVALATLCYAQILLGALVRHGKGGLACGTDMIRCAGEWWPHWLPGQLQMVHRIGALLVCAIALYAAPKIWRAARARGRTVAYWSACAIPILVIAQMAVGLLTVATMVEWKTVTIHLGFGALLLAASATAAFELRAKQLQLRNPSGHKDDQIAIGQPRAESGALS